MSEKTKENFKKALFAIIPIIVIVTIVIITVFIIQKVNNIKRYTSTENKTDNKTTVELQNTSGITLVPTMRDTIAKDSSWCGTFQLVWNDMKNKLVKQDVVFNPQLDMVENLNRAEFDTTMLSENYYLKIYGLKTLELKQKIEDGIKEKFNQTSDVLKDIDWSEKELDNKNDFNSNRYIFYTMLYRKFEFLQQFSKLENGNFRNKYNNIEYFGIDSTTNNLVGNQINILYYNSKDDFAIIVNTKTNDEVIFYKNPEGNNFAKIYENMNKKAKSYKGNTSFDDVDEFKAPKLTFNEKREYNELENKTFKGIGGEITIEKAIQTIKLSLDEKGGEIKSESILDLKETFFMQGTSEKVEPRYFYLDDTFAMFLREKGKSKPYFAVRIDDITKFQ